MQKNIKIRRINQIFNKVGSSNGKNKRDVVLKKIDQDITKLELFTKTKDYVPILLDNIRGFLLPCQSKNVLKREIQYNIIKNRLTSKYLGNIKFYLCLAH